MNTELLIAELATKAAPVRQQRYWRVCLEWLLVSSTSFAIIFSFFGFREDLLQKLSEPLFVLELICNLLLILIAGFSAIAFAFPGRAKAKILKASLVTVFLAYSGIMGYIVLQNPFWFEDMIASVPLGLRCLACILMFATIPAAFMFWRLKTLAAVKPAYAGGASLLMAVALGCLGILLEAKGITTAGVILWHYLPLLLFSVIGLWMGKKIFRW